MTIGKLRCLAVVALALLATPVAAHHGTSGSYDASKVLKVEGTVKEFRWRNPHSALFIVGKDAAGKPMTYALEMGSPATLVKVGYTAKSIKPGDKIIAEMHPSFTNPANGYSPSTLKITLNGKLMRTAAAGEAQ